MRSKQKTLQFTLGIVIILATLGWLGYSGVQESKTYYVTVSELFASSEAHHRRFRVAGDVAAGSIQRADGRTRFQLQQEEKLLTVVYTGTEPLPDTLVDGAGRFTNANLHDYLIPTIRETPAIRTVAVESYEPHGPFGAKEIGEGSLLPILGAIANAIYDACGVRVTELPITPEKILAGLKAHSGSPHQGREPVGAAKEAGS